MRLVFVLCLGALLLSTALIIGIEHDSGYILVAFGRFRLEMTFWMGLFIALILALGIFLLSAFMRRSADAGRALATRAKARKYRVSERDTDRGLIAFVEGNWEKSRDLLESAADNSRNPLVNYLIAAQASDKLDDSQGARKLLQTARETRSDASIAVEITQAEMQLARGQYEESLATLESLKRDINRHPHVLNLYKELYIGLCDWESLMNILPDLRKYRLASDEAIKSLELRAAVEQLDSLADRNRDSEALLPSLKHWWQQLPKPVARNSDVLLRYVRQLIGAGGGGEAERLIKDQLKREWRSELILAYGLAEGKDARKQLLTAENWLKERTNDAALLLSLGRLSLRNELWGKARDYFESSYRLEKSPEVCAELGRLLANLGEHEKSNGYFQEGLSLNTHNLPQLPMPHKALG